jgi:molybdopterin converting factor small subunit
VAKLRLFGPAREQAGVGRVELPGPSVGDVLDAAEARFGEAFARVVTTSRIWVNGQEAQREDQVAESDEVAVLPPVAGG